MQQLTQQGLVYVLLHNAHLLWASVCQQRVNFKFFIITINHGGINHGGRASWSQTMKVLCVTHSQYDTSYPRQLSLH